MSYNPKNIIMMVFSSTARGNSIKAYRKILAYSWGTSNGVKTELDVQKVQVRIDDKVLG